MLVLKHNSYGETQNHVFRYSVQNIMWISIKVRYRYNSLNDWELLERQKSGLQYILKSHIDICFISIFKFSLNNIVIGAKQESTLKCSMLLAVHSLVC